MPYCLFRFATAFRRPGAPVRYLAALVTVAIIAFTFSLQYVPLPGLAPPPHFVAYRIAFAVAFGFLFTYVVVRLAVAGTGEPPLAATRMHLLALAVAGLESAGRRGRARPAGRRASPWPPRPSAWSWASCSSWRWYCPPSCASSSAGERTWPSDGPSASWCRPGTRATWPSASCRTSAPWWGRPRRPCWPATAPSWPGSRRGPAGTVLRTGARTRAPRTTGTASPCAPTSEAPTCWPSRSAPTCRTSAATSSTVSTNWRACSAWPSNAARWPSRWPSRRRTTRSPGWPTAACSWSASRRPWCTSGAGARPSR